MPRDEPDEPGPAYAGTEPSGLLYIFETGLRWISESILNGLRSLPLEWW